MESDLQAVAKANKALADMSPELASATLTAAAQASTSAVLSAGRFRALAWLLAFVLCAGSAVAAAWLLVFTTLHWTFPSVWALLTLLLTLNAPRGDVSR